MALEDEVRAQTQSIDRLVNQLGSRSAPLPSSGAAGGGEMPNLKQADGVFAGLIQGLKDYEQDQILQLTQLICSAAQLVRFRELVAP